MRQRRCAIGHQQRVELDKAVTLLGVVADDFCPRRQLVAGLRGRQKLHAAAHMNPGTKDCIVDQHLVHHPLHQDGMGEIFPRVDRIGFPDVDEIVACCAAFPLARDGTEPFVDLKRGSAHRLALANGGDLSKVVQGNGRR